METVITILSGVLVSISTYMILSRSVIRIILGISIFSHGVHLLLLTMGGLKTGSVPLLGRGAESFTDALPQALILTSIVISFAVTALLLVLAYRVYQELGTDNVYDLRGFKDDL
ncbi:Na(+)/H(+) antiporter subunit C [Lentibacillus sp. CBA3610]|uniref:Na(+)/H(+) antiporter subunit C n=1 Tax=Lentibacillus sp. CBA3610 TaxID=2518176 RepID=UPI001595F1A6|nr:Na(+)/H(+) antiporter subunit C [Lentibacillus sp. CBA3610]QKY70659.1 Na(+)/H(+) antiporter subunit C [Lentibacillus sp. CBA3610]